MYALKVNVKKMKLKTIVISVTIASVISSLFVLTSTFTQQEYSEEGALQKLLSDRRRIPVQYTLQDVRDYYLYNPHLFEKISSIQLKNFNHTFTKNRISSVKEFDKDLPVIYVITPTYTRYVQRAELTNMCSVMKFKRNILWIVIEDSENKTDSVVNFLTECEIPAVHMNFKSRYEVERTIDKRNAALQWIKENTDTSSGMGVVFFADDDNTYDPQVFDEMRNTKKISVWPVALVSVPVEGPIVKNGKVIDWISGFDAEERAFPIDMAAFAFNVKLLHDSPNARFRHDVKDSYLETTFIESLGVTQDDFEPKAKNCTKVLVWHTRTAPVFPFVKAKTKTGIPVPPLYPLEV